MFLPETLGQVLPDTIEQVEELQRQADAKQRYRQRVTDVCSFRCKHCVRKTNHHQYLILNLTLNIRLI